jgi:hypothetical protein
MANYDAEVIDSKNRIFANELKSSAFSALGQLESAALGIAFSQPIYNPVDLAEIGHLDRIDISGLPTVQEVMGSVRSITADAFPQAPSTDELAKYKKHVWESGQLDNIQTALAGYIDTMGLPDQTFQDAVFDADRERKQKTLSDSIDLIAAKTSARGFKYAEVQTNAAILDLMEKHQFDQENLSRKITELMTDWARQNLQFALQQGTAVEVAHMEFAYKYSSIFRDVYTTLMASILDKYRTQVQMEITKLEAVTKAVLMRADVLRANADIGGTEARLNIERSQQEIQQALGKYQHSISDMTGRGKLQIDAAAQRAVTSGELIKSVSSSVLGVSISKGTAA